MLKKILIALAVIVIVLRRHRGSCSRPNFASREAPPSPPPPAAVFAQVNDFHKWEAWNPWGKIDPAMKQAYEGAPAGTGAIYTWAGNKEVGEGRMTITESRPSDLIRVKLEFFKPFAATNTAEFTFKPEGNQTARDMEYDRRQQFHGQGNPSFHEHGQNDRRPIREGARRHEIGGGSIAQGITRRTFNRPKENGPAARICSKGRLWTAS